MINFKQEQLVQEILSYVNSKFPEVKFIGISESPEDPQDLWIRVTAPVDEDRKSELMDYACDKTMDILMEYGYHMLVMPTREQLSGS
ncbi:hypothetical protein QUF70_05805 [Desulfobacterales bacterium HSG17]|nr:hypothetical protein [Desulfobacterales bacterium HSG17]